MAAAAAAGMGVLAIRFYETDSTVERALLREVVEEGLDIAGRIREDQANRIISALGEAMGGKKVRQGATRGRRG